MKYTIVGSGPAGLSLAYILALNNCNVEIIEQYDQLGGSWNSDWIDGKYFTENSPRVFLQSKNSDKLLSHLGFTSSDFQNIYGNFFETNYKFINFTFKYFNLLDYLIFLLALIKYRFINEKITVATWMEHSYLSQNAKKCIKILSIVLCDRPDKTNVSDFFSSITTSGASLKQMKEPNKWHQVIEDYLNTKNNVKIIKNTQVVKINQDNTVFSVFIKNVIYGYTNIIRTDKVFLCTQSNGIYPILKNSSETLKNNWMPISQLKTWSENTFYSGFGFQLHFDEHVNYKNEWCWSCNGDWTVIILPVSNWLKTYTKDPTINTVWSCCIVDMDTKSKRTNKTANESNYNEVLNECIQQIKDSYNIPTPKIITTSPGLKKYNNVWISKNTGYTKNIYNDLNMEGNANNLFALGCFTKMNNNGIAFMGSAIDSVAEYLSKYEKLNINIFN